MEKHTHDHGHHDHSSHHHVGHHHDHGLDYKNTTTGRILFVFLLNLGFAIIEIVGGFLSFSMALIADGLHDLLDAFSIGVAYLFEKKSYNEPTEHYHFGFRRYSILSAFVMSIVLIVSALLTLAFIFMYHSSHQREINSVWMMVFAVLGLAVNGFAILRLSSGSSHQEKVISWHLMEDLLGWLATLVGAVIIYFTGWQWVDIVLAVLISVFIFYNGCRSFISILPIFLQRAESQRDVESSILGMEQVESCEVKSWSLDGSSNIYNIRMNVTNIDNIENLKEDVYKLLKSTTKEQVFMDFQLV